jgi:hypothetical protein
LGASGSDAAEYPTTMGRRSTRCGAALPGPRASTSRPTRVGKGGISLDTEKTAGSRSPVPQGSGPQRPGAGCAFTPARGGRTSGTGRGPRGYGPPGAEGIQVDIPGHLEKERSVIDDGFVPILEQMAQALVPAACPSSAGENAPAYPVSSERMTAAKGRRPRWTGSATTRANLEGTGHVVLGHRRSTPTIAVAFATSWRWTRARLAATRASPSSRSRGGLHQPPAVPYPHPARTANNYDNCATSPTARVPDRTRPRPHASPTARRPRPP